MNDINDVYYTLQSIDRRLKDISWILHMAYWGACIGLFLLGFYYK